MSILVFIENIEGEVKASSLEAVSYAAAMGGDVTALVLGSIESSALDRVGKVSGGFRQDEIRESWTMLLENNELDEAAHFVKASFSIECSSGFYVRQLASDLGEIIGIPSMAWSIKRTRVGSWT